MSRVSFALVALLVASAASAVDDTSLPTGITTRISSEGPIFTSADGMSLYVRKDDRPGESRCLDVLPKEVVMQGAFHQVLPQPEIYRSCIQQWPPLQPQEGAVPIGDWSILTRPDGMRQWLYKQQPIYRSAFDRFPGEITVPGSVRGQARSSAMVALAPFPLPGGIVIKKIPAGISLATGTGKVLYTLRIDSEKGKSNCTENCLRQWNIVKAPAAAVAFDDWSVVFRKDGDTQWAWRGKPVYTANAYTPTVSDSAMPVILQSISPPPPGIVVGRVAYGPIYTTADGMSLYAYSCRQGDANGLSCDRPGAPPVYMMPLCGGFHGDCSTKFKPLLAPADAAPVPPLWTIVKIDPRMPVRELKADEPGVSVWAYYGRPLYTYVADKEPGDYYGQGYGQEAGGWRTVTPYGLNAGQVNE